MLIGDPLSEGSNASSTEQCSEGSGMLIGDPLKVRGAMLARQIRSAPSLDLVSTSEVIPAAAYALPFKPDSEA